MGTRGEMSKVISWVIPAEAGIQVFFNGILDSRLRGNDALALF